MRIFYNLRMIKTSNLKDHMKSQNQEGKKPAIFNYIKIKLNMPKDDTKSSDKNKKRKTNVCNIGIKNLI